jgi:hypothetical protein
MRAFFAPNLQSRGRIVRGLAGGLLVAAGLVTAFYLWWAGLVLGLSGLFALYEATRGWCVLRACGIRTKI